MEALERAVINYYIDNLESHEEENFSYGSDSDSEWGVILINATLL